MSAACALPDELWRRIIGCLGDHTALCALSATSRRLRRLANAPEAWKALCAAHGFQVSPPAERPRLRLGWESPRNSADEFFQAARGRCCCWKACFQAGCAPPARPRARAAARAEP